MKRTRKQMSDAERVFKDRFDEIVLAKRPIVYMPERRSGIVDAHHVISKSWLADRFRGLVEPEELWLILWDPDNGLPVDRFRHEQITNAFKRLEPVDLRPENHSFAEVLDVTHRLEQEVPLLRTVAHGS